MRVTQAEWKTIEKTMIPTKAGGFQLPFCLIWKGGSWNKIIISCVSSITAKSLVVEKFEESIRGSYNLLIAEERVAEPLSSFNNHHDSGLLHNTVLEYVY